MLTALLPTVWTLVTHQAPTTQQVAIVVTGIGAAISLGLKVYHDVKRHQIAGALKIVETDPLVLAALHSLTTEVGKLTGNLPASGGTAPPTP
jgi:hypothetical protein